MVQKRVGNTIIYVCTSSSIACAIIYCSYLLLQKRRLEQQRQLLQEEEQQQEEAKEKFQKLLCRGESSSTSDDGPLIDGNDNNLRSNILKIALERGNKEMVKRNVKLITAATTDDTNNDDDKANDVGASNNLSTSPPTILLLVQNTNRMIDQVGGKNDQKQPLLRIDSIKDIILKPIRNDHRGCREIAFYESIQQIIEMLESYKNHGSFSKKHNSNMLTATCHGYARFLSNGGNITVRGNSSVWDIWYQIKARLYFWYCWLRNNDHLPYYTTLVGLQQEIYVLYILRQFIPKYYGVIMQRVVNNRSDKERLEYTNNHHPFSSLSTSSISSSMTTTTTTQKQQQQHDYYLCLDDLTSTFDKPCVMDIKLGTQTYEPDAPSKKKLREAQKYLSQSKFGLRIVGMRVYDGSSSGDSYRTFDKHFGRSLEAIENLENAIRIFFSCGDYNSRLPESSSLAQKLPNEESKQQQRQTNNEKATMKLRIGAIRNVLSQLKLVRSWFEEDNKSLAFYASSLLIVYEGKWENSNENNNKKEYEFDRVQVKMIDLARVRRKRGGDAGYVHGLTTFISVLEGLLQQEGHMEL